MAKTRARRWSTKDNISMLMNYTADMPWWWWWWWMRCKRQTNNVSMFFFSSCLFLSECLICCCCWPLSLIHSLSHTIATESFLCFFRSALWIHVIRIRVESNFFVSIQLEVRFCLWFAFLFLSINSTVVVFLILLNSFFYLCLILMGFATETYTCNEKKKKKTVLWFSTASRHSLLYRTIVDNFRTWMWL